MPAFAFRFIDEERKPTGWYGLAFAPNMKELFWQIDEHGNPNMCEIQKVQGASFCFFTKELKERGLEILIPDFSNEEKSPAIDERTNNLVDADSEGWRPFPNIPDRYT